jgi:hypothetical protein
MMKRTLVVLRGANDRGQQCRHRLHNDQLGPCVGGLQCETYMRQCIGLIYMCAAHKAKAQRGTKTYMRLPSC